LPKTSEATNSIKMLKHYCDACGCEITRNLHTPPLPILVHCLQPDTMRGHVTDIGGGDFHPTSGRCEGLELCLPCYTLVADSAVRTYRDIQKRNGMDKTVPSEAELNQRLMDLNKEWYEFMGNFSVEVIISRMRKAPTRKFPKDTLIRALYSELLDIMPNGLERRIEFMTAELAKIKG